MQLTIPGMAREIADLQAGLKRLERDVKHAATLKDSLRQLREVGNAWLVKPRYAVGDRVGIGDGGWKPATITNVHSVTARYDAVGDNDHIFLDIGAEHIIPLLTSDQTPEPEKRSAWQPLATAPKDGTAVLLRDEPNNKGQGTLCWWNGAKWCVDWSGDEYDTDPAHVPDVQWAPLPE